MYAMTSILIRIQSTIVALAFALGAISVTAENRIPEECKTGGFYIGCIAYTFDLFTLLESLEKTAEAGGRVVELCAKTKLSKEEPNVAFDYHASAQTIQKVKDKLAQCKLKAVTYAVIPFPADEAEARKLFEFVKMMGIRAIVTEPAEPMDLIEKLVKEYDIMVGFHNHPGRPTTPVTACGTPITSCRQSKTATRASAAAPTRATGCVPTSSRWSACAF